jgi:hypothetical protein
MFAVENWLNGQRNFYVGKSIYKTLGSDQQLKELLEKGKTPIAEQLLLKAMQKLMDKPAAVATSPKTKEIEVMPDDADPVLHGIHLEWKKPYQEMNYKRHELDRYKGNTIENISKRKELAFEILELEQVCMKIWEKRDYYKKNGKLPDVSEKVIELPDNKIELATLIDSIKKNIRRNRLLMKSRPGNPTYAAKYDKYKLEFKKITGVEYDEKN